MTARTLPKVWGVGLPRTGTTTLCEVLRRLGYGNVIHNPHLTDFERADAAADNECAIFYRYLDYRFPGSRFILTTRSLVGWLPSVKHILDLHPVRSRDENIPIFRRMTLYGAVTYDPEIMAQAYRRHHDEVRWYFRNRPDDLLEIDFTQGQGWEPICRFLDLPVPDGPFPHANARP